MQLTIRVGAAVDRSLSEAYRPLIEAANRAAATINRIGKSQADQRVRSAKAGVSAEEREYAKLVKETEKWRRQEVKAAEKAAKSKEEAAAKAAKAELAAAEKLSKQRDKIRERSAAYAGQLAAKTAAEEARTEQKKTRDLEREMAKRQRDANAHARTMAAMANRSSDDLAKDRSSQNAAMRKGAGRAAGMVGSGARAAAGFAAGIAGDLARGAGVDTDFGGMARRNSDLLMEAQNIANSGYSAGDSRNGMRVSAQTLADESLAIGRKTGLDANDALQGLGDFVGKTGDLATAREIFADMARLSKATGANLSDMMAAAGGVAMAMGDTDDKAGKLNSIMNSFAAQGKLGAVEIKDLASQMDKMSAQAGQFEGNVADNMVMLGALAQAARQGGGAANASQAANSVAAFTSMLKTPKRAEEFKAATGVDVFNKKGMLRNPQEIITEALRAKGMDPLAFKTIFANVKGAQSVEKFATIYRQAGGGKAGEEAVAQEFDRLKKASIDAAEAQQSFALAMKQPKSQAEVYNQTMREMTMRMQNELTPALVALAPAMVEAAKAAAKLVQWITGSSPVATQVQDAQSSVGAVIAANRSGLASGNVNAGQKELNFKAQGEADRALAAAKAEAVRMKGEEKLSIPGSIAAKIYDNSMAGMIFRAGDMAFGSGKGNGIAGTIQDSRAKDTAAAEARVAQAEELQKQMLAESQKLTAALLSGQVKVQMSGQAGPPGVSDDGRTPPPGAN